VAPRIAAAEPLALEIADFANAITTGEPPRSGPALGLEVVRALEAAQLSLERNGQPVELADPPVPAELASASAEVMASAS
jgi:predicted dehydrogenase